VIESCQREVERGRGKERETVNHSQCNWTAQTHELHHSRIQLRHVRERKREDYCVCVRERERDKEREREREKKRKID